MKRIAYKVTFETPDRRGSIEGEWRADRMESLNPIARKVWDKVYREHDQLLRGATSVTIKLQEVGA